MQLRQFWLYMTPLILIAGYWNLAQAVQAFGFAAMLRILLEIRSGSHLNPPNN